MKSVLFFILAISLFQCSNSKIADSEANYQAKDDSQPFMFINFQKNGKAIIEYLPQENSEARKIERNYNFIAADVIDWEEKEGMKIERISPDKMKIQYKESKTRIDVIMETQCEFIRVKD